MNIEALNQLIRVLNEVIASEKLTKHFNLVNWVGTATRHQVIDTMIDRSTPSKLERVVDCGTTACACGYAAIDPWFNNRGLRFETISANDYYPDAGDQTALSIVFRDPESDGRGYYSFSAISKFFNITHADACDLFVASSYEQTPVGPQQVIDRLRKFMQGERY